MPELEVILKGNVSSLDAALNKAQKGLADTAVAANKIDSSLDAATKSMDDIAKKANYVAKSFSDVSKEIFATGDAFDTKWNKVIAEAAAEADNAGKKILTLSDAVAKFGGGVKKFTSPIAPATDALEKNKEASGEATQALTNLGRVAQDLPFGFIGIANNLNPLLESFQRLRATSGSNSAALKALGSSLTGAGGLGLALSAVTAILQLSQLGFAAWTRGFGSAKSALDANTDSVVYAKSVLSEFEQELQKVVQTASQEATKVSILFSAIGSANTSLKERKELIGQLIEISPRYFQGLEKEKTSYEDIAAAVGLYTSELANVSRIKALLPEAEKIFKKILDAQIEIQKINELKGTLLGLTEEEAAAETKRLSDFIRGRTAELVNAKKYLTQLAGGEDLLSEILFGKPDKKESVKKRVNEVIRQVFPIGQLADVFPVKIPITVEPELKGKGDLSIADTFNEAIRKQMEALEAIGFKFPDNFWRLQSKDKEGIIKTFNDISDITTQLTADVFGKIAENLGNFQNPFAGIFEILGESLTKLGKYVIFSSELLSQVTKALNAALSGVPGLGIAVGIGLIALGQVFKNIPHMAAGGIVPPGYPNDSFPAMLQSNEAVIPLDRLGELGGGMQVFIPEMRLQGNDIVIAFNRASKQYNRSYGIRP